METEKYRYEEVEEVMALGGASNIPPDLPERLSLSPPAGAPQGP